MSNEKLIFSKMLNYYMNKNGKTQVDLINDLGINKSTISTWCNGTKMPRMGTIQTLADYFGIMKSDLIEEKPATIEDDGLSGQEKQLSELFKNLNEDNRDILLDLAASLKRKQNQ